MDQALHPFISSPPPPQSCPVVGGTCPFFREKLGDFMGEATVLNWDADPGLPGPSVFPLVSCWDPAPLTPPISLLPSPHPTILVLEGIMTDSRGPMHMCRAEFIPGKQQGGALSHPLSMDPWIPRPTLLICSGLSLTPPHESFLQITVTLNSFVLPLEVILIEIANTHRCQPFFLPIFLRPKF